jgi:ankyrin repeat protein
VAYLIGKGAAVDARDRLLKTPLHMACAAGHTAVTKILLENNADAFEKDSSGRTALHYAACSSAPEQLILLGNDPDLIHMKDHAGRTALHYAVFNESQSSVKMVSQLLHLGADVNSLDNDRRTALHHAAEEGKDKVIPVLLQAGASTGTRDAFTRKTAFELAKNDRTRELMIVYSAPPYLPK